MKKILGVAVVLVSTAGLMFGRAYADNNFAKTDDTAALKAQVQQLDGRIAQLEKQLAQQQIVSVPSSTATAGYADLWDPWAEMKMMQSAMGRMSMISVSDLYNPLVDIKESSRQYIVTMDIPGMAKENINVKVEGHNLIVSGDRTSESERNDQSGNVYTRERSSGRFMRSVPLPEDADTGAVDAQYNNGVLTMKVGRTGKGKGMAQNITVK